MVKKPRRKYKDGGGGKPLPTRGEYEAAVQEEIQKRLKKGEVVSMKDPVTGKRTERNTCITEACRTVNAALRKIGLPEATIKEYASNYKMLQDLDNTPFKKDTSPNPHKTGNILMFGNPNVPKHGALAADTVEGTDIDGTIGKRYRYYNSPGGTGQPVEYGDVGEPGKGSKRTYLTIDLPEQNAPDPLPSRELDPNVTNMKPIISSTLPTRSSGGSIGSKPRTIALLHTNRPRRRGEKGVQTSTNTNQNLDLIALGKSGNLGAGANPGAGGGGNAAYIDPNSGGGGFGQYSGLIAQGITAGANAIGRYGAVNSMLDSYEGAQVNFKPLRYRSRAASHQRENEKSYNRAVQGARNSGISNPALEGKMFADTINQGNKVAIADDQQRQQFELQQQNLGTNTAARNAAMADSTNRANVNLFNEKLQSQVGAGEATAQEFTNIVSNAQAGDAQSRAMLLQLLSTTNPDQLATALGMTKEELYQIAGISPRYSRRR